MKRVLIYVVAIFCVALGTSIAQNKPSAAGKKDVITFNQGKILDPILKHGDYIGAIWAGDRFGAVYGIVKIVTPASDATKGEYEIEKTDGNREWTKNLILRSRPAFAEELKPGMLVLYWNDDDRRGFARWFLCIINKTNELSRKKVEVKIFNHDAKDSFKTVDLAAIRIIEEPILKFKLDGPNYMRTY